MKSKPKGAKYRNLTEPGLEEIERMARENAGEPYRGALLALDCAGQQQQNRFMRVGCPTRRSRRAGWVPSEPDEAQESPIRALRAGLAQDRPWRLHL